MKKNHINDIFNNFKMIYTIESFIEAESNIYKKDGELPLLIKVEIGDENLHTLSLIIQNLTKSYLCIVKGKDYDENILEMDYFLNKNDIKFSLEIYTHNEQEIIVHNDYRMEKINFKDILLMNKIRKIQEYIDFGDDIKSIKIGLNKNKLDNSIKRNDYNLIMAISQIINETIYRYNK